MAINVITVTPSSQRAVSNLQVELVDLVKRRWPGFLLQRTLVSADGTRVTTVEEYASMDSLQGIVRNAELLAYRRKIIDAGGKMDESAYSVHGETIGEAKRRLFPGTQCVKAFKNRLGR